MATPRNPYQPDPDHEPQFLGRRDIFQMVEAELRAPDKNSVLLFGPPRIGKTCLLRELQRRLPSPPFLPCYFDLRDRAHGPLSKLLFDLASALAAELHVPAPIEAGFDDQGAVFQTEFLPAFYRALPGDYRPVVLLDGFDLLEVIVEKQPQASSSARHFPPYLQRLLETEPRLGFVYAATRRIEDFSTDMQDLLRTAREKRVGPLDEHSARALVKLGQDQGSLAFAEDAVERVLTLTARHPYLLQLVCHILFQRTHGTGGGEAAAGGGVPLVTAQEVEAVTRTVLEVGEPYFEGLWAELSAPERVVLSTLAEGTDEGDAVTDETMHTLLRKHGIRILTREMELAPEALVKREVLLRTAAGYQFAVELMRRFVALRQPPEQVEAERRQIVPAANSLYQSAVVAHGQGQLVGARDLLERALRMNPNHVQARLRLGQVLQEQGHLDEACRELEEALKYAPEEARFPLIRTLLLAGEALERGGGHNADRALEVYERVLALHQREPVALERSRAILRDRGDRAFRAGDLDQALQLYERSGDQSKAEAIRTRKRTGQVDRVAADALGHESRKEWAEAYAIYKRLFDEEGDRWQVELRRTEAEVTLQRHYGEAQQALAVERWGAAARSLGEVVALRPDYKDAAARLAQASAALWREQQRARGGIWGVAYALPQGPAAWLWILCGVLVVALGVQGYLLSGRGGSKVPAGAWVALAPDGSGGSGVGIKQEAVAQVRDQGQGGMQLRGGGDGVAGSELAEQGIKDAAAGELDKALNFFRQAYRAGGDARWLYDLGVLHDRLGQCDDAAFFYRASVLGKGVQKEDVEPLNGRLSALEEACHFKARQSTAADRHQRAARFMELELCALAQSVLTGIVTAQEKAELVHCSGAHPELLAVAEKKKPPEVHGGGGHAGGGLGGGGGDLPSLLTVTAKPWAVVLVDGQKVGRTPLDGYRIAPGKHVVTLVNDELKGRQSYPINLVPGNTVTITYAWQK